MSTNSCSKCSTPANTADSVQIDDKLIHKRCFKCQTCGMALTLTNFGVHGGKVYCKRHLALLTSHRASSFRERATTVAAPSRRTTFAKSPSMSSVHFTSPVASSASSASNSFGRSASSVLEAHSKDKESLLSRVRSPSTVIRSKTNRCVICNKAAYPTESIKVDQLTYHKRCFKCEHCKCRLTMGGFAMINTNAYCKPHFKQLFQSSGGKYDRAFGSIWDNSSDPKARSNTVIRKSYAPPVEAVFSGTAESIRSPTNRDRKTAGRSGPRTLPRSIRLNPKKAMTAPVPAPAEPTKFEAPPAAPTVSPSGAKKVALVAKPESDDKAPVKTKKRVTIDLPPQPTASPPPEPKPVAAASKVKLASLTRKDMKPTGANGVIPSALKASTLTASAKAEDPVAAFFRALKSNNTKTLTTALTALAQHKKLGVVVAPSSQLTNMTPVEYAYVTRKIPVARVLVGALKEHFDAL